MADSETVTAAKIARYGVAAAAAIAAVSAIVVAIVTAVSKDSPTQASPGATTTTKTAPPQPNGTIERVTVSQDGTEVTVRVCGDRCLGPPSIYRGAVSPP